MFFLINFLIKCHTPVDLHCETVGQKQQCAVNFVIKLHVTSVVTLSAIMMI